MTRGRIISVVLAAGVALIPLTAAQASSSGQGPKHDQVDGTGRRDVIGGVESVHVNADSGPNGEDPRGQIRWTLDNASGTQNVVASVTCLEVNGNMADLEGII